MSSEKTRPDDTLKLVREEMGSVLHDEIVAYIEQLERSNAALQARLDNPGQTQFCLTCEALAKEVERLKEYEFMYKGLEK